jgi:hypothetical protein
MTESRTRAGAMDRAARRPEWTHAAYCDESGYTTGRFRALAAISLPRGSEPPARSAISDLLRDSGVKELSWKDLRGARERFASQKVVDLIFDQALRGVLRMDAVVWDTYDSRHNVRQRDDVANLGRMYHHLLRLVLGRRWEHKSSWLIRPDENDAVDWDEVDKFLRAKEADLSRTQPGLLSGGVRRYRLFALQPADSAEEPLVQAADLFAGLAVFSREKYDLYAGWARVKGGQTSLLEEAPLDASKADEQRFAVLEHVKRRSERARLPVSLASTRGLRTRSPRCPVNFWLYRPQSPLDRAPTKTGSRRARVDEEVTRRPTT